MLHPFLMACAALALASPHAAATPPQPGDATAAVPETHYRAATAYRPAVTPTGTPDRHWIEANRTVAGYNSMMLTMPERAAPRPPAAAQPAQSTQPAQPASGHGHDHGHDHGAHAGHGKKGEH